MRFRYFLAFLFRLSRAPSVGQQPLEAELKELLRRGVLSITEYKALGRDLTAEAGQKVDEFDQQSRLTPARFRSWIVLAIKE